MKRPKKSTRKGTCGHVTLALYTGPDKKPYCFKCGDKMWKVLRSPHKSQGIKSVVL